MIGTPALRRPLLEFRQPFRHRLGLLDEDARTPGNARSLTTSMSSRAVPPPEASSFCAVRWNERKRVASSTVNQHLAYQNVEVIETRGEIPTRGKGKCERLPFSLVHNRWTRIAVSGALVAIRLAVAAGGGAGAATVRRPLRRCECRIPEGSGLAASRKTPGRSGRITTRALRCSSRSTARPRHRPRGVAGRGG